MRPGAADPRAALRALAPGSLVLGMADPPNAAARRIALALLEEEAALGGGHVTPWPGALLLLGASRAAGDRAGTALGRLLGIQPELWGVPDAMPALEAWLSRLRRPAAQPTHLVALEERCAAVPVEGLARLTFFAEGSDPRPVAQRLSPVEPDLEDLDLRAQARALLCRRLLSALTDPTQQGRLPQLRPGLRLLLDLPLAGLSGGRVMDGAGGRTAPIALLPLAALAEPGFRGLSEGLAGAGWRVGFVSRDPEALALLRGDEYPLAAPPPSQPPMAGAPGFIALGPSIPAWCRAPGTLWEVPA
jgi:hypothetical protein